MDLYIMPEQHVTGHGLPVWEKGECSCGLHVHPCWDNPLELRVRDLSLVVERGLETNAFFPTVGVNANLAKPL